MTYDGLDASAVARLTGAPRLALHASVPSALDVVHALGAAGAPSGSCALTEEQTAGRGRAGRRWHSPPGAGIWLAVLLRPAAPPLGGALAIRAGLAAHQALRLTVPRLAANLKWPNDIVVAGRKLGGILCEARWSGERPGWIAVGVGLNVHGPVAPDVRDLAAAVADVDPGASRVGILAELVPRLTALASRPAALDDAERAAYLRSLWMPPGEGPVLGIDPDGALVVRRPDGSLDRRVDAA